MSTDVPKIFRVTVEVADLDEAAAFYSKLLGTDGKRHPGARHYFDCGGVILAVLDPSRGGLTPTPGPKSLYFAVGDVTAVHARATQLGALAPYKVHGEDAGARGCRAVGAVRGGARPSVGRRPASRGHRAEGISPRVERWTRGTTARPCDDSRR